MNENKQHQTENKGASNAPTHVAYHVREVEDGKDFWTRIGSAWPHKDGNGFTIQLNALPVDGRLTLRRSEERPANPSPAARRKQRNAQPAPN